MATITKKDLALLVSRSTGCKKNLAAAMLALAGAVVFAMLAFSLISGEVLAIAALGCSGIGLATALATLMPKLMKSMQNAVLYMYHIGHLLMAFMSCLAISIIIYW